MSRVLLIVALCLPTLGCGVYNVPEIKTSQCYVDLLIEMCRQEISQTSTIVSMPGILPAIIGAEASVGAAATGARLVK